MAALESTMELVLDDGTRAEIKPLDPADAGRLHELAGSEPGDRMLSIRPTDERDTRAHSAAADVVVVTIDLDDTAGHAFALRFPHPDDARRFEQRLVLSGVLAGAVALGAIGIATQASPAQTGSVAGPVAAPAPAVPLTAPRVAPGLQADIKAGDVVAPTVAMPKVAPGLQADINAGDVAPAAPQTSPAHNRR
jgi:hypothetical protein